ncbi:hypothetical protein MGYG_05065 [Nannizzia gypsea CBS 118893]|uniref:C2H2-type domain-containing protein n=1 Tax=Arthroderma gypseum (strain ATCC MYA-4604 / CBS 118893) TaxID=535722 RepID=E4UY99_ARTGP|nr:hypothetical protein MGYG_05065 [Nannizzia gypsea CBS 118893]EFR02062.1 hypothetical protein MGYG_05065 [Nannizzia gypsea CBS 118893]
MSMETSKQLSSIDRDLPGLGEENFDDPFLNQLSDAELSGLHQTTPDYFSDSTNHPGSYQHHQHPGVSTNPSDLTSPASQLDFLSPTEHTDHGLSDFTRLTSPDFDAPFFASADPHLKAEVVDDSNVLWVNPHDIDKSSPGGNNYTPQKRYVGVGTGASQLLSPVPTNTPSPIINPQVDQRGQYPGNEHTAVSPQSMTGDKPSRMTAMSSHQPPTLITPNNVSKLHQANNMSGVDHQASPIVKVSSFTRGDSPSRAGDQLNYSPNQPSLMDTGRLSPAREARETFFDSDDEDEDENDHNNNHKKPFSIPPPARRLEDGSWSRNPNTGHGGLDPSAREDVYVPSLKELAAQRERDERNAEVAEWITRSEAPSEADDNKLWNFRSRRKNKSDKNKRRAKSAGDPFLGKQDGFSSRFAYQDFDDSAIPGPGVLIDEDSGMEDDEDDSSAASSSVPESPPASVHPEFVDDDEYNAPTTIPDAELEPLPNQFLRARPWQDSIRNTRDGTTKFQPTTSNAAIMRFLKRADSTDTASRAATWGTRGPSECDVESIIGPNGRFSTIRISEKKKDKPMRRNSLLEHARGLLPKRSNSSSKRKHQLDSSQRSLTPEQPPTSSSDGATPSTTSLVPQRKPSFNKGNKHHTGGAILAMTGQMATVGRGGGVGVPPPAMTSSSTPWSHIRRRSRSKSDLTKGEAPGGLLDLIGTHGGPPIPTLASPKQEKGAGASPLQSKSPHDRPEENDLEADDDDEDMGNENGVTMEFPVRSDPIVPTLEGFKTHIRQLNPRLQPALIERIGQEQVRRYKRLVELRLKHTQNVSKKSCSAGKHCFAQGGDAVMLPPRTSPKDPEATYAQFQVPGAAVTPEDVASFGEGAITPALFPPGVPLPPVRRLPAEFECSLCFKVRKFLKPSDWTKHVHEDVQPFTCTFPDCTEPKSFKRKADWVRHESERHRHLEWWTCNMPDCSHTCFRKDNFVQHLVREHKMPEPKVKATKVKGKNQQQDGTIDTQDAASHAQAVEQVWKLVEVCRQVTTKQPMDEACRFCGNVCNSWKKLTVHMAKHMEQIAMPVLELVNDKTSSGGAIGPLGQAKGPGAATPQYPANMWTPTHHTNHSVESTQTARAPKPITYGTSALLTEAFGLPREPAPKEVPQQQTPEYAVLSRANLKQQQYTVGRSYTMSPYLQAQQQQYHQPQGHPHKQYSNHLNSASYPPAFSTVTQDQQSINGLPMLQPLAEQGEPGLSGNDMYGNMGGISSTAPIIDTKFEGEQLFASPVDNGSYMYSSTGQETMEYSMGDNGMSYHPMMTAVNGGYIQNPQYNQGNQ